MEQEIVKINAELKELHVDIESCENELSDLGLDRDKLDDKIEDVVMSALKTQLHLQKEIDDLKEKVGELVNEVRWLHEASRVASEKLDAEKKKVEKLRPMVNSIKEQQEVQEKTIQDDRQNYLREGSISYSFLRQQVYKTDDLVLRILDRDPELKKAVYDSMQ